MRNDNPPPIGDQVVAQENQGRKVVYLARGERTGATIRKGEIHYLRFGETSSHQPRVGLNTHAANGGKVNSSEQG